MGTTVRCRSLRRLEGVLEESRLEFALPSVVALQLLPRSSRAVPLHGTSAKKNDFCCLYSCLNIPTRANPCPYLTSDRARDDSGVRGSLTTVGTVGQLAPVKSKRMSLLSPGWLPVGALDWIAFLLDPTLRGPPAG